MLAGEDQYHVLLWETFFFFLGLQPETSSRRLKFRGSTLLIGM